MNRISSLRTLLLALSACCLTQSLHAAIEGCTDPTACNYNADATVDDGSCVPMGCMDPDGLNFNPNAGCQTTCIYPGDCDLSVTINTQIAYGFSDAFGLAQADVDMPMDLLDISESMMMIVGGDDNANGATGPDSDHHILWVAQENINVQFAFAVASWDAGIQYDWPYYAINGDTIILKKTKGMILFSGSGWWKTPIGTPTSTSGTQPGRRPLSRF